VYRNCTWFAQSSFARERPVVLSHPSPSPEQLLTQHAHVSQVQSPPGNDHQFTQVIADLSEVTAPSLRDATSLTGLLIAAAGAAGFATVGTPVVRQLPEGGVAAVLFLDGGYIILRTLPDREMLLLDILAPATRDSQKALDVFTRRLAPKKLRSETRTRG
jgi:S-adenosylmethionine/arginine decarboxylase-like enzyme